VRPWRTPGGLGGVECARACAALQGEAAALRERLARIRAEDEKQRAWHDQRLRQAQGLADEGRLRSALGLLGGLTGEPAVHRLRADCGERLARFERYLRECREHLDRGEVVAARGQLARARTILPDDPELMGLAERLQPARPPEGASMTAAHLARPIYNRSQGFALADQALAVLAPEAVIGNPLDDTVHLPMQARIHRRHARLVRERGHYRVEPCSARCAVRVNGRLVERAQRLHGGDRLGLGKAPCEWVFRLLLAGSLTAVLEADPAAPSVWTPAGQDFRRVVLLDEAVSIRPRGPAHLLWPDLPCDLLLFRWRAGSLMVEVEGGSLAVEAGGAESDESPTPRLLPTRLTIRAVLDEAERLGRSRATRPRIRSRCGSTIRMNPASRGLDPDDGRGLLIMTPEEEFTAVCRQRFQELSAYLARKFPRIRAVSDDLAQAAYLETLERIRATGFRPEKDWWAYLCWLATQRAKDYLRQAVERRTFEWLSSEHSDSSATPWEPADSGLSPSQVLEEAERRGRQGILLSQILEEFCRRCRWPGTPPRSRRGRCDRPARCRTSSAARRE
jgi:hypothetical protein